MLKLVRAVFDYGAVVFAVGFLWPLFAQLIVVSGWVPPFGLSPLAAAAVPAFGWGLVAQIRGSWLWLK